MSSPSSRAGPTINWSNLLAQSEASVEQWLWQADVASDVMLGESSFSLKKVLLCLLESYGDKNRGIVTRVYQMMQDVDVLCPLKQGYTPNELEAFTAVFLHNLNTWLSVGVDTVQAILEFCSLAAHKNIACVVNEAEFISTVCRAAVLYAHNKSIQRACSNLFLAVIRNALLVQPSANAELLLASTAKMLPPILENISFHRTDHGVLEKSLAILHVLASHPPQGLEALRPFADSVVTNLLAILSGDQIPYVDVLAPCLLVLNIVAEGDTALLQIATSLLHKFGKFAGSLVEEDVAHEQSALVVHAFQLLQRIVCDEHVMLLAFDDQPDARRAVSGQLHSELEAIYSKIEKEHLLNEKEKARLGQVINALLLQQKDCFVASDFEQTEVEDKATRQQKLKSVLPPTSPNQGEDGGGTVDTEGKGQTWRGVIDNDREEQVLQHAATGEAWTLLSEAAKEIEALKYELMARNSAYTNSPEMKHLVELSRHCQQQSAVAINRADMMHKLFLDAAKRVEELLVENDALRAHVQYYQTQEEEGAAPQGLDEEEREEFGGEGTREELPSRSPVGVGDGKKEEKEDGFVPVLEDRRQTLAAAGIVEGLAYISAQRSKSSIDSSPGRASVDASVSIEAISTCAACLVQYFFNIKENLVGLPGDQLSTSLIALSSIRKSLKGLGMLDTSSSLTLKDVDIIFSQLHVHYVTLSGFAYTLLLCAGRRYKKLSGSTLLDKLSSVITKYFQNVSNGGKEDTHYFHLDPAVQIPQEKVSQVQRLLGEGETMALRTIFQSYLPDLPRSLGPSPVKKGLTVVTQGMTLEMIVGFAIDFGLVPNVITRSQIREVFAGIREGINGGGQQGDEPSLGFDSFLEFLAYLSMRCPSFRGDKDVASCPLEERFGNMLYFLSKSSKGLGKISANRVSTLAVCKVSESMLSYAIRNVEEKKSHERKGKNLKLR